MDTESMVLGYGIIIAITGLICLYYWSTFPKLQDSVFIRAELRVFYAVYFCVFVLYAGLTVGAVYLFDEDETARITVFLSVLIMLQLVMALESAVLVLYPQWRVKKSQRPELMMSYILEAQRSESSDDGIAIQWQTISYFVCFLLLSTYQSGSIVVVDVESLECNRS